MKEYTGAFFRQQIPTFEASVMWRQIMHRTIAHIREWIYIFICSYVHTWEQNDKFLLLKAEFWCISLTHNSLSTMKIVEYTAQ